MIYLLTRMIIIIAPSMYNLAQSSTAMYNVQISNVQFCTTAAKGLPPTFASENNKSNF
ncbi:MAG: hypothetical protein Q4D56_04505 [Bacteroides sp.]|nr:hypothetical protein [Bacteroides sp.]